MTEIPAPRENPDLVGHRRAERELRRLLEENRLAHAILLTGPRGIGKATLAFRFARFVLAGGQASGEGLTIEPESGVFRRVAAGGHADLLTIERAFDPRRRRLRSEIVVDDAREISAFLRLTAAEEGWRVVIVDGVEEMSRAAANAVLKILEEPPQRALLLLVSHAPGRLLPTIRSRCRKLTLLPLAPQLVSELLERYLPEVGGEDRRELAALAQGSIGRALDLAEAGGVALYRSLLDLLAARPRIDVEALYAFLDKLLRPGAEDSIHILEDLVLALLARLALAAAGADRRNAGAIAGEERAIERLASCAAPARWAVLREDIEAEFLRGAGLNLDRRQTLLGAFFAIERTAS